MLSHDEILLEQYRDREVHLIPDGEGSFVAVWPDLPGCAVIAPSMEEALEKAQESRTAWFKALLLNALDPEDLEYAPAFEEDDSFDLPVFVKDYPDADDLAMSEFMINEGDCTILIEDTEENLSLLKASLEEAGFSEEEVHPELPETGVFINLYFEVYASARKGARVADAYRNKSVTVQDFLKLAEIYERIGSLEEGISETDQAEISRIYYNPEDPTFGELIEQLTFEEEPTIDAYAECLKFSVPVEWNTEQEDGNTGFFCSLDDEDAEFSAYYASADLSVYETPDDVINALDVLYSADPSGAMLVRSERMTIDSRPAVKYSMVSADQIDEITKVIILDGMEGFVQVEYSIPKDKVAYLQEGMENVLKSCTFLKEIEHD